MNWFLIVVLAIIITRGIQGYRKGIIKMVVSIATLVLSIVGTLILAPILSDSLCNSETIFGYVTEQVRDGLGIETKCEEAVDNLVSGVKEAGNSSKIDINDEQQKEMIGNLGLPEKIQETMIDSIAEELEKQEKVTIGKFSEMVTDFIARIIIKAITYIAILIILKIVLKIIFSIFNVIERMPIIENMSEIAGGLVGVASGLVIVWILFLGLLLFSTTSFATSCYQCINESEILTFLYNNNLIVNIFLKGVI